MNLGSAGNAFVHLHRRVIAGAIACGLSLHQRSRLHFVQARGKRLLGLLRIILRPVIALFVIDFRQEMLTIM